MRPDNGFDSFKAVGYTEPDPQLTMTLEDGIEIALGHGVTTSNASNGIAYNEYPLNTAGDRCRLFTDRLLSDVLSRSCFLNEDP